MKYATIRRIIALILILAAVLCFAACQSETEEKSQTESLREDLKKVKSDGVTLYLGKKFTEDTYGDIPCWTDGKVVVIPVTEPLSSYGSEAFGSAKEYRDQIANELLEHNDVEAKTGKTNGIYYLVADLDLCNPMSEDTDITTVAGFYLEGETLCMVLVLSDNFQKYEDDMINYATLCQVKDIYSDDAAAVPGGSNNDVSLPSAEILVPAPEMSDSN